MYVNPRYPMDDVTVDRLVIEAKGGNTAAFAGIFDEYAAPIYRFIASRVKSPSDAEDLTQLVFVKALEALPRYEARGIPFGGWLFRLARNAVVDFTRTRHEHADLDAIVDHGDARPGPEEVALTRQDLDT